jgi:hypothetical protein
VIELCGIEQTRTRIGSTASYGVESHQFLSAKLHLGRAPGVQTASYFRLAAGEHNWPFQIQLPADLPPSVTHPSGNARIVYEVRAQMTTPGDRDGKAFVIFNVVSVPRHRAPKAVERTIDKPFGLQRNEPLHVRAVLQHDLYVPGDLLKLRFFVDNASRKTINGFRFDIVCEWRYGKEKTTDVISSAEFAPTELFPLLPRAMFETVAGCALPPPPLPQSIVGQTMSCTYRLRITAEVAGVTNRDVSFDVPFVVVTHKPKAPPSPRLPTKTVSAPASSSSSSSSSTTTTTSSTSATEYTLAPPLAKAAQHAPGRPRSPSATPIAAPSAPPMSSAENYGAAALPYDIAVVMPHSAYSVPTRATAPRLSVDGPPPPAPAPAGTFEKKANWIEDDDFVRIDDSNDDRVDDLVVDNSLPSFNPELGLLTAPSVNWGVSPRTSPNASPRTSGRSSPSSSPTASPKTDARKKH